MCREQVATRRLGLGVPVPQMYKLLLLLLLMMMMLGLLALTWGPVIDETAPACRQERAGEGRGECGEEEEEGMPGLGCAVRVLRTVRGCRKRQEEAGVCERGWRRRAGVTFRWQ